ncbi:hypothetical protein [Xenorhabdus sp. Sc-CR9]|uniref:hypothetical protein n=1 Tax=Xenorhabdus sp. Sc-CR9 TaxID=2584468 RepID=UPI001F487A79|nr:hypothetical protein [Xenorhabdus sp. Sc-CR9]
MKKYIFALLLLVSFGVFAQSTTQSVLQKYMKSYQPLKISDKGGIITLTMKSNQVTTDIYHSVVKNAICGPLWLDDKNTSYLKEIKEVRVLNKHSYIGFAFENPRSSCEELGKAMDDMVGIVIASHTHIFTSHMNR